jgi:hypothetical protein
MARHVGPIRIWLSRGTPDGLCMLLFDPRLAPDPRHAHSVLSLCSGEEELAKGLMFKGQLSARMWAVIGAAPDNVSSATVHAEGQPSRVVAVVDNVYYATSSSRDVTVSLGSAG